MEKHLFMTHAEWGCVWGQRRGPPREVQVKVVAAG